MLISTKGRYALRVMVDLAEHSTDGFIPLKMIAARQNISEKYLENIIKLLVKAKLLTGVRGKGGGYRLTKSAGAIYGWGHSAYDGGFAGARLLSGARRGGVLPRGGMPHAFPVEGAGQSHQRLSG